MIHEEARKGRFTASGITRLLAEGSGKTRITYIIEVAKNAVGIRDSFETSDTAHGINNQVNAFDLVVKKSFEVSTWCDKYIPINDNCGASPDVVVNDAEPLDIKCPTTIDNYLEQISETKNQYYYQSQMQMMALNAEVGYLCYYLTRKEEWGSEWREYDMPLEDRYKINVYRRNAEAEDKILSAVEKAAPLRDILVQKFMDCQVMDEIEFFYGQRSHGKFRKLSYSNNPFNVDSIFRVGNEFYYKVA